MSQTRHQFAVFRFHWNAPEIMSEEVTAAIAKLALEKNAIVTIRSIACDPGELVIVCDYWLSDGTD